MKSVYKVLVRKYEGKKPHGRTDIGQRAVTELIWRCKQNNEQRYNIMNTLWASAHERFFAAAVKQPQRPLE